MAKDSILSQVGDFGLYQKLLCGIFVFYTTFLCGLNYYTQVTILHSYHNTFLFSPQVFIFLTPEHRCSDPLLDSLQTQHGASWDDLLPWIPRLKGYPK